MLQLYATVPGTPGIVQTEDNGLDMDLSIYARVSAQERQGKTGKRQRVGAGGGSDDAQTHAN